VYRGLHAENPGGRSARGPPAATDWHPMVSCSFRMVNPLNAGGVIITAWHRIRLSRRRCERPAALGSHTDICRNFRNTTGMPGCVVIRRDERPHRTTPSNQPAALGHCVARGAKNGLIGAGTVVSSLLIRIDNCYCRTVAYSRIIRLPEAALQPKRGGPGRPVEQRRLAIRVGDSGRGVIFRTPASMPVRDGHDTKSRGVAA
jgi:hypothetical protein